MSEPKDAVFFHAAAKRLNICSAQLARLVKAGHVPPPLCITVNRRFWRADDFERIELFMGLRKEFMRHRGIEDQERYKILPRISQSPQNQG